MPGRDPVSLLMDAGTAKLLARAYARPGRWAGTSLKHPGRRHLEWARSIGIDLNGPDNAPGGEARTRWMRAFIRSLYWQHKWYYREGEGLRLAERRAAPNESRSLVYEVGRIRLDRRPGQGVTIRGRAVRVKVMTGGTAAMAAVKRKPDSKRIYDDARDPAGRWADPAARDW